MLQNAEWLGNHGMLRATDKAVDPGEWGAMADSMDHDFSRALFKKPQKSLAAGTALALEDKSGKAKSKAKAKAKAAAQLNLEELPMTEKEKKKAQEMLQLSDCIKSLRDYLSKYTKALNECDRKQGKYRASKQLISATLDKE